MFKIIYRLGILIQLTTAAVAMDVEDNYLAKAIVLKDEKLRTGKIKVDLWDEYGTTLIGHYYGYVKNNIPHGWGTLTKGNNRIIYRGHWINGKMHGLGKRILRLENGEFGSREGMWINNEPKPDRIASEVDVMRGLNGWYIRSYPDHSFYAGNFVNNRRHGEGFHVYKDGSSADGFWQEDQILHGTLQRNDWTYEGPFFDGRRHGFGKIEHESGQKYEGDWNHGIASGKGTITFKDGTRWTGQVENEIPHGPGVYHYKNGDYYDGNTNKGFRHGFASYYTASTGFIKIGNWENDVPIENNGPALRNSGSQNLNQYPEILVPPTPAQHFPPSTPFCIEDVGAFLEPELYVPTMGLNLDNFAPENYELSTRFQPVNNNSRTSGSTQPRAESSLRNSGTQSRLPNDILRNSGSPLPSFKSLRDSLNGTGNK